MKTVPARYEFVPQPVQSFGGASLSIPIAELFPDFEREMVREAVGHWADGRPIAPREIEAYLEDAQLVGDALSFDEWCRNYQPIFSSVETTYERLKKLAGIARDLADDDGPWQDDAQELRVECLAAVEQLVQRAQAAIHAVLRDKGNIAAQRLVATLRNRFAKHQQVLHTEVTQWDAADRELLDKAASRFARLAVPRTRLKKFLARRSPMSRASLTSSEQKEVTRLIAAIQTAADKRFSIALRRAKLDALRELLGDNDHPGRLQSLADGLRQARSVFDRVNSVLESQAETKTSTKHGNRTEIKLVENLQSPIDQQGTTLGQLYRERAEQAGWNAARLADVWRDEGLSIDRELVFPHEWSRHAPTRLARHCHTERKSLSEARMVCGS